MLESRQPWVGGTMSIVSIVSNCNPSATRKVTGISPSSKVAVGTLQGHESWESCGLLRFQDSRAPARLASRTFAGVRVTRHAAKSQLPNGRE